MYNKFVIAIQTIVPDYAYTFIVNYKITTFYVNACVFHTFDYELSKIKFGRY